MPVLTREERQGRSPLQACRAAAIQTHPTPGQCNKGKSVFCLHPSPSQSPRPRHQQNILMQVNVPGKKRQQEGFVWGWRRASRFFLSWGQQGLWLCRNVSSVFNATCLNVSLKSHTCLSEPLSPSSSPGCPQELGQVCLHHLDAQLYSLQAKTGARLSRNGDNLHFCQDGLKAQIQMAQNTALKLNSYIMEIGSNQNLRVKVMLWLFAQCTVLAILSSLIPLICSLKLPFSGMHMDQDIAISFAVMSPPGGHLHDKKNLYYPFQESLELLSISSDQLFKTLAKTLTND